MATPDKVRSFTLLGGPGSGKSALAEALLYRAGVLHQAEGGRVLDFEPEEERRSSTVFAKVQNLTWHDCQVHFADTPGLADFIGNAIAPLVALDAAVVVVDATSGVDVATRQTYELAVQHKKPVLFFINKMDKERADFPAALASIRKALTRRAHPVVIPIGEGADFRGVLDLVESSAITYDDGKVNAGPVGDEHRDAFDEAQAQLMEEVAGTDEALFEKLASGEQLTREDMLPHLITAIKQGEIVPVLAGSSFPPKGTTALLDAIVRLLAPATEMVPPEVDLPGGQRGPLAIAPTGPVVTRIFKIYSDQGVGDIFYMRIVTGTVKSGDDLINTRSRERERIAHLLRFHGKERSEVTEATVGDVIAVAKLKGSSIGDTLASAERQITLDPIDFPNAVHSVSVHPKTRKDQDKLGIALSRVCVTDPTLHYHIDPEFNETILSGMGELHLELAAGRLKERYGIEITVGKPHVAYRETLTKKAKAQGRHKKQTGGHGQFGDCHISVEPLPIGGGFEFADEIKGGVIPGKFIPSVETGVRDSMKKGALGGFPVVDVKVTLFDGSFHSVDSSDVAFQLAGALAFRKCQELAGSTLLEPIMRVSVTVPADYVGAITNQLSQHRGRILGMDGSGDFQTVTAEVPQSELFDYSTELRSITQGSGTYAMGFAQYEPVPSQLVPGIIEKLKQEREEQG